MTGRAGFDLEGVSVRFPDVAAIEDVSLRIASGERLALVGPSGAGKTTLLRALATGARLAKGSLRIGGEDVTTLNPGRLRNLRARLGTVHQDLRLVPNLSVLRNVLSGRLGRWSWLTSMRFMLRPTRPLLAEVHELLERLGIVEKLYQRADTLSGGQQQRVAIARALFQEPIALFADEPVASVDPARARALLTLLTRLCTERDITLCVSLHDLELAREFFPRLVGLRDGRVLFDRAAKTLTDTDFAALYSLDQAEDEPMLHA